ncbi:UDP-glucose--hexose-1-phosphate uridylyltransferase [Companilactobacillus pabuli]|mgnify:FL=1|jgi:UDPglucose--hexose-1-phosphate uridylyltransferase|uniref:Galactose-1-phosphate uridylyltransferase n=1 Tax=Companilactobacillus pabuli TaxID=2714036 RepID=A0A7L7KVW7_9LACO|nr:UDP-glucose--hexose-1-phosphate uridylyltransferase [Companilactobacillus pabuli]AKP03365.1 galactose-1-phosphate uridylyltransferase [Companilactobacillus farciminis]AKS51665.1 galactose-1-phosphate uridylyltransferase [Companilactobacillus farciminis]MDG5112473.1 UDP-glucose--hexose-1-phosphate uridylyltransferase [Companilactobacillus pabuli]QMT83446.1 UDP-glucose--hexose-1-phosphate uridylyltransferase [Companilactobacillus pabuli]
MSCVDQFVDLIVNSDNDYQELDKTYLYNRICALVGDDNHQTDDDIKTALIKTAIKNGKIEDNQTAKEILNDQLMDFVTPLPSKVNAKFWNLYQKSPETATNYFYKLSQDNDYIKVKAIAKNISYQVKTDYGNLEITINLSKPEKDPKAIALAGKQKQTGYPKCQLCMENEGYLGRLGYPARSNHRIIRFILGGQTWGFQYSPYAYFNEHAIFLNKVHQPMIINQHTFNNLLEIIRIFPQYFVGSNADLPIVGGSMLSHDHYQGGRHQFPMMKAKIDRAISLPIKDVKAGIVKWPLSTIRLTSADPEQLIAAATLIHENWKNYSDETVDVRAFTKGVRHHTVTPIAYKNGENYVLDIVLRDNQTSKEFPDGIFHPHQDVQHIKKENIGLIEVMGRAILPARLKDELKEVERYLLKQPNQMADYHKTWADQLQKKYDFNEDNVSEIVDKETGLVFGRVLEDAGVFKWNTQGQKAFDKFIGSLS